MQNPFQKIQNKIKGGGDGSREFTIKDIIEVHHRFMKTYGWISLSEFRKLPIPSFWNLHNCINEDARREQEAYDKSNKGGRTR